MDSFCFGPFTLDTKRRILAADGRALDLHGRPFDILTFLVANRDRVVSRDEIVAHVWQGQVVAENNITVQMSNLRRVLAERDANGLIITVPNKGYRFVGEVSEQPAPPTPPIHASHAGHAATPPRTQSARSRTVALALASLPLAVIGAAVWPLVSPIANFSRLTMAARVQVAATPDEVAIAPDGYRVVDYVFSVLDLVDLQLETEDVQFYLTNGEPVGPANIRGRIHGGSFAIRGGTVGVYHNNIYLPADVAAIGKSRGGGVVQLRHIFHLRDVKGDEVNVPAVLRILIGP